MRQRVNPRKLTIPVPTGSGIIAVNLAFPVIYPDPNSPVISVR